MKGSARLSRRLLTGLAAGLGLASLVFLVLFIETYRAQLGHERASASEQVTRLLQVSLENAMLKRDLPGLREIVDRLGDQPGVAAVRIVNPSREVRFSSDLSQLNTYVTFADLGCPTCQSAVELAAATHTVRSDDGREMLRSINPIPNKAPCAPCHGQAAEHPVNGILIVDHDASGIRTQALGAAAVMSGAGLLVVLVGMGATWLTLKRQVLSPIQALDAASRELAAGHLDLRVPPLPSRDDEIAGLCRSFNAMAERIERGVDEIREKEAFLQLLIDTVPDGVRVIDESMTVVMSNRAYARQAGGDGRQLIGEPCYRLHGRNERCPPTLETCPFHAITSDGEPIRYVHRHVRGDGGELYVETSAARLTMTRNGKPERLIVEAIRDLEQQVKYSHEQRLSEIGQLAAGVAHEIYNPLASVRIGLQAMLRRARTGQPLDEETQSYLATVDGEVTKCIEVTKRLLDLSQVPSQRLQLVSFSTVIPEVMSLLRYDAEQGGVTLRLDLGPEDLRVFATDSELRMLILNLAQNAFHAMPKGGTLTITGRHIGDDVDLRFSDAGVGIEPDKLAHIFEPFYSRRADGVQGTGLGLTICKAIVTRYRGRIEVESRLGVGTVFTVVLPRADREGKPQ